MDQVKREGGKTGRRRKQIENGRQKLLRAGTDSGMHHPAIEGGENSIQPEGIWEPQRQQQAALRMAMLMQLCIKPQTTEYGLPLFSAQVNAILQTTASTSWSRRPSADTIQGVKWHC